MRSRIDTLLSKFQLLDCRDDIDNPTKFPSKQDYTGKDKVLQKEREEAIRFLKKAFGE